MDKAELRKNMQQILKNKSPYERHQEVSKIHTRLLSHSLWKTSHSVGMTISTSAEIDTHPLIKKAWEDDLRVAVPKCDPKSKTLSFRHLLSFDQLETVYYGLKEPIVSLTESVKSSELDMLLVPGLCFDTRGYRIGFGGGYYDRFLADYKGVKVALAFSEQLVLKISEEPHDIAVDYIITPNEIISCHRD